MPATRPNALDFDVVVLGGGPAGCATALSLARHDVRRVLVVEATAYEHDRVGESIPPDARRLFGELGLLETFAAEGHEPCHGSSSAWGSDVLGFNDFVFNPCGSGWHLDRRRFDAYLAREARSAGIEVRTETRFLDVVAHGPDRAELRLGPSADDATLVSTRFVVDATGFRALYARGMGSRRRFLDRLISASAFFTLPEGVAFQRLTMLEAVEYGWWYVARLPGRRVATAVASSPALFKSLGLGSEPTWLRRLAETHHVAALLAACQIEADSLSVQVAPSFLLHRIYGGHWLAVGDAASCFDPISSQGVYKALSEGVSGGRAIGSFLDGDADALEAHAARVASRFHRYAQQRAYFYDIERRWPDAPFWQERRSRRLEPALASA